MIKQKATCLAVLGTGSDVGKSVVTTAICRILVERGIKVCPFKAQNMSNNSGVTPEGLEMGRAQIVQAEAAKIAPHVDMNPVLLKPTGETGSQVVVLGKVVSNQTAREYYQRKRELFSVACQALERLRGQYDVIVIEGAGSCAEVNLMPHDMVNLRMAEYADAPVMLVADIHKGGVFAQIVGTLECLDQHQKDRIAGFLINRFRGDLSLFHEGEQWIEQKTGKKSFGVLPWFNHFRIEAEDSVVIECPASITPEKIKSPAVAIIRIPHISNFTDFDPLYAINDLSVHFLEKVQDLSPFSAVIIPGSKCTRDDLDWLMNTGWSDALLRFCENGGHVLGICGGYQMLGHAVHDPDGFEGFPGSTRGLSLLPVETRLVAPKTTTITKFSWDGVFGTGYEIHMGRTDRIEGKPLFRVHELNAIPHEAFDGSISQNGQVMGTYMHGLFDSPEILSKWLFQVGIKDVTVSGAHGFIARDAQYDLLAEHFKKHIDIKNLLSLMRITF
ncbi:MAG: cobyric acid synthase [Desulfobacterales bacterium]|jgi:adenosylcobyric acid synthase|nr:cobyric acid synthase [Desulfobacterales bacterium]